MSDWESLVAILVAVLIAYAVVLWLGSIVWAYRDIRARTQDGWTQAVSVALVMVFNLPGLLLYLVLRPQETLNDAYERRMEAEAFKRDMPQPQATCPTCRLTIHQDYLVCPNCRTRLREACSNCSRPLEISWSACPYCTSPGPKTRDGEPAESSGPPPLPSSTTQSRTAPETQAAASSGPSATPSETR